MDKMVEKDKNNLIKKNKKLNIYLRLIFI